MNEPIMRRGLSPEGRRIRQKHQGILFNDEHGVTSFPSHRKIEKDFLKENVMRLKEIQAKCRTQELKSTLGMQPVKALRTVKNKMVGLPNVAMDSTGVQQALNQMSDRDTSKLKEREGSAHSDYFSLSDEAPLDLVEFSNIKSKESITSETTTMQDQECQVDLISDHLVPSLKLRSKSANSICMKPIQSPQPPPLYFNETKFFPNTSNASKKFGDYYPHSKASSKISNLLEKLKCKKPACDTNASFIWRDLQKHHRELMPAETELSNCTPRSGRSVRRSVSPQSVSSVRFQSLDRVANYKNKSDPNANIAKSNYQSTDDLSIAFSKNGGRITPLIPMDLNQSIEGINKQTPENLLETSSTYSESLPELSPCASSDRSREVEMSNSQIENDSRSNCKQRLSLMPIQPNFGATYTKVSDDGIKESSTPLLFKQDPLPVYRQNASAKQRTSILRSKSSCNLHMAGEPPPSYKRGQVPKYLQARKAQNQKQQEALAAIDPLCPPGHVSLPDNEKINTLHLLKKGQMEVMQQLAGLPVAQDTLRVRKLKQELESKLNQIEEGIQIFSQTKVYVINDE